MADALKLHGPVHIQSDSPQRVAYDLMMQINQYDKTPKEKRDEAFFLDRYTRCLRAIRGNLASPMTQSARPGTQS
jgi:hypothetical protein